MPTPSAQTPGLPSIDPVVELMPPFPPPQTFDILPSIHAVLSRLPSSTISATAATNDAAHTQNTTALLPNPTTTPTPSALLPASVASPAPSAYLTDTTPLDPRNLPQAMAPVKIKIQKARVVVSALPDVQRSLVDQEEEIRELEGRIGRLRGVLGRLGRAAEGKQTQEKNGSGNGEGTGEGEMDTRA